jgi:hypothetical protein
VGNNFTIAWAAGAAAVAMILALGLSWRELWARPYAPYAWLRRASELLDKGEASRALQVFKLAGGQAARHGDLAALAAAWRGIARAREALGDKAGAAGADATAEDGERQVGTNPKTA